MKKTFQNTLVLSRVMNTGIIMSIEKSERELAALETLLKKESGKKCVSLFNSITGAIHGALWGQDIVEGDRATLVAPSAREEKFLKWLNIQAEQISAEPSLLTATEPSYSLVTISEINYCELGSLLKRSCTISDVIVVDLTDLGFGPCAAMLCSSELVWKRAERLKIFGAFDLRTMWTQEESELEIRPMAQFNYRLSPLVAACVRMTLIGEQS